MTTDNQLSQITAAECFMQAAEVLRDKSGSPEVAREWRILGEVLSRQESPMQ